jgi:ATPases with chaperone activity, ATP-binding subunit
MTSNLGSERVREMSADTDYEVMKNMVLQVVTRHFRPEFINRIDDIVVFHSLRDDQIQAIAGIQIGHVAERLREQNISIQVSPAAMEWLGNTGFDPIYGARPLKRAIQNHLETPLAKAILAGVYGTGHKIMVDLKEGGLQFSTAHANMN